MLPRDLTGAPQVAANGGRPEAPDDPLGTLKDLSDAIGQAALANAKQSAAAADAGQSKDFAAAVLDLMSSLDSLFAMLNPEAPNAEGDNPAKRGD